MRILTNERKIKRNRRLAQIMFAAALGILIGSMVLFWTLPAEAQMQLFWLSTLLLVFGLVAAISAVRLTNDWVRIPRPEDVLNENLKGLGNNYALYHYWLPAHHVLVSPHSVLCLTVRAQQGDFAVKGQRWRARTNILARLIRFFRQEQIGNPTLDANHEIARVQAWLDRALPDSGILVEAAVVFTAPGVTVTAENPSLPALYADSEREPSLRRFVTGLGKDEDRPRVTREQRRAIEAAATGQSA